ncbi:IS3 family transposase [Bacillus wiedmannii]
MKCEKYYFKYDTFEELSQAIDEYIQFYMTFQNRLNSLSPMEYRTKSA